jgi:hypothetical protein
MAYAATPDAPRTRPSTVRFAVILLYVVAALQLINAIIAIANYGAFKDGYAKAYANTSLAGSEGTAAAQAVGGSIVVGILLAIVFTVFAILVGRGNRVGRILTWVFCGIAICCIGSGFAFTALAKSFYDTAREQNPDLPPFEQLENGITSALPSWYGPVTTIIGIVSLLAVILVIILLALPASNAFFRKSTEPQWEPPLPPSSGPTAPSGPTGPAGPTGPTG